MVVDRDPDIEVLDHAVHYGHPRRIGAGNDSRYSGIPGILEGISDLRFVILHIDHSTSHQLQSCLPDLFSDLAPLLRGAVARQMRMLERTVLQPQAPGGLYRVVQAQASP